MTGGIRATVAFPAAGCPIAAASRAGTSVDAVANSVGASPAPVTEFTADSDCDPDPDGDVTVEPVFSFGSATRYRLDRGTDGVGCPCECLGEFGVPVERYFAQDGTVTVVFYAADYEELQIAVGTLRERFPDADIKRFVRSPEDAAATDTVFVDRSRLTDRQLEAVETAYEMGYFERPRTANAEEVADALGVSRSTFTQHLAAAQSKLLGDLLEDG